MSENKESKAVKTSEEERLSAFYAWTAKNEFTVKDMEAVLCGVVIQAEIAGFKDSITIGNKTFDIEVKLHDFKPERKNKRK